MICYRCGQEAGEETRCPACGADLTLFKKVRQISNVYYNLALEQAEVRNLSGAIVSLKNSLKFDKYNINARNLLGLIYCEMGEVVNALSEWVISKSYRSEDNLASRYLDAIQQNRGSLESVNQTIKKYNMALAYCQKDSRDLAIIQLKKVLSLNPKMVKAHQLLALLYIEDGKLDQAKKTLRIAGKIDTNNTLTLRYLKEVNARQREKTPAKKQVVDDDLISYQSGNETIIMPKRFKESSLGSSLLYIVTGLIVGAAVTAWLFVPNVKNNAKEEAQKQLAEVSDTISTDSQTISDLEAQVEELQTQLDEASSSTDEAESKMESYELLLAAYDAYYKDNDSDTAETKLAEVKKDDLSSSAKMIYNSINSVVQEKNLASIYSEGYSAYMKYNYEEAAEALQKVVDVDEDYSDGNAAYYLAQSLRKNGDLEAAKEYYQYIIDNHPNTERAKTSKYYVD